MKIRGGPLLGVTLAVVLALAMQAAAQDVENASLKAKGTQKWTIILPQETWSGATSGIGVAHMGGDSFPCEAAGVNLMVDTNGDGRVDHKVKGIRGNAKLTAKDANGNKFTYHVRFRKQKGGWQYAAGGYMAGKLKGVPIKLIDQNNNGVYNEYGADAMVVGRGDAASFLSKVVNLKGSLYEIDVSADGSTITAKPYQGEVGTLDVVSGWKARGKLLSAVVSSGDFSFNLARRRKGMKVPVGDYTVTAGLAGAGKETCRIRAGRMAAVAVKADATARLVWGAPVTMEFDYSVQRDKITVRPNVRYFGNAGEEYFDWNPDAVSPKITVSDAASGRTVATGRFGGC